MTVRIESSVKEVARQNTGRNAPEDGVAQC